MRQLGEGLGAHSQIRVLTDVTAVRSGEDVSTW